MQKLLLSFAFLSLILFSCRSTKEQTEVLKYEYRYYPICGHRFPNDTLKPQQNLTPYKFADSIIFVKMDSLQ